MTAADATPDQRALESLLAFWAEAGVDATYAEAPIDRLAEGKARLTARPASPPPTAAAPRVARSPVQAAPDIAGQGKADPTAAVLSVSMLLDHVGETEAARRVEAAVAADLAARDPKNPGSTAEIGERLAKSAAG